jgi:hypothetical protein
MSIQIFHPNGQLAKYWNDVASSYTEYNTSGVQTSTRPYTSEETARAVAEAALRTETVNKGAIEANIIQDLAAMQTIIDTSNSVLNDTPASAIKDVARAIRRLDRMMLAKFDGTN